MNLITEKGIKWVYRGLAVAVVGLALLFVDAGWTVWAAGALCVVAIFCAIAAAYS